MHIFSRVEGTWSFEILWQIFKRSKFLPSILVFFSILINSKKENENGNFQVACASEKILFKKTQIFNDFDYYSLLKITNSTKVNRKFISRSILLSLLIIFAYR